MALHRQQQDLAELLDDIAAEWPEIDPTLTGEHLAQPVAYFKRIVQEATDLASEIARTREDQYFSWTAQSSNNRGQTSWPERMRISRGASDSSAPTSSQNHPTEFATARTW